MAERAHTGLPTRDGHIAVDQVPPGQVGPPIEVAGPHGRWDQVRERIARTGSVLVHDRIERWLPQDLDDPVLAPLLGRDYGRFRRMTHPRVRSRFAASRRLLKHAAGAVIDAAPETVELAYRPGGRPFLRGLDQIDISLSHTESLLLVGLTRRGWIGVDAELTDREMLGPGSETEICTPHERKLLAGLADQPRNSALVRLWTLKEAYSKAIGQGLRLRFTEFGFGPPGDPVRMLRPDGSPGTGREWAFETHAVAGRYTVSMALYDAGFGDTQDTAVSTMLDERLVTALINAANDPR